MQLLDSGPVCCSKGIKGFGNINADVLLCGVAPGRDEAKRGRPFIGASGNLLNAVLDSVGVQRDDLYCTNACCWVNNEPTKEELMPCLPRLIEEIATIKPKLIVGLGGTVSTLFMDRKITAARGYVCHYAQGADVFAPVPHFRLMTFHPSAFLHGKYKYIYDIQRDLAKIPDVLTWPLDGSKGKVFNWHTAASAAEAQRWLDSLPAGALVTIDIETTSEDGEAKDIFQDTILCLGFTSGNDSLVVNARDITHLSWRSDLRFGFHGGIFDAVGIRLHLGFQIKIAEDSLYQSYVIDERAGKEFQVRIHGLGPLSGEYCGTEFYKESLDRKRLAAYPEEVVHKYNATDVHNTFDLINLQSPKVEEEGVEQLYYNILIPAANAFADITYRGCAINHEHNLALKKDWLPRWMRLHKKINTMAHEVGFPMEKTFNCNSWQQKAQVIYDLLGLPVRRKGDRSTDKDHLQDFDHPFVNAVLEYQTLDKMMSTYLLGFDKQIKKDGLIHPEPILHGTVTGRLSYRDPPIQTIPKPFRVGADLGSFRRMFVPHNPITHCFVEVDYEQLEIWIAQYLSQDKQMLIDLESGDYHGRVTTTVYGLSPKVKGIDSEEDYLIWNERRTQAKRITFQRLYQGGASTLANRHTGIGCTLQEATDYIRAFNDRYPGYNKWCNDTVRSIQELGFYQTPFGRKRRFPILDNHREIRQALNFPIQSIASDVCLTSLIELHAKLAEWDSYVIWTVHDSILFEVSRKFFTEVTTIIKEVMTKPRHETLPSLKVDITAGENYYDQIKLKDFKP